MQLVIDNSIQIPIVFVRAEGFYIVPFPKGYSDWAEAASLNPGTLRIEDVRGNVLWRAGGFDRSNS